MKAPTVSQNTEGGETKLKSGNTLLTKLKYELIACKSINKI